MHDRARRSATASVVVGALVFVFLSATVALAQAPIAAAPTAPLKDEKPGDAKPVPTSGDAGTPPTAAAAVMADEVLVSFQGANIDTIVQWLAELTGKSIIKHKDVNCSLNVLSSRKVSKVEALRLVYGALALEGYTAVENRDVIVIVPDASADKIATEVLNGDDGVPEGRQVVFRVFTLRFGKVERLKDKLAAVLTDKAKIDVDSRANKIFIKDYAENVKLAGELIKELDIATDADTETQVFQLVHVEAENLVRILTAVFATAPPGPNPQQQQQQQQQQQGGKPPKVPGSEDAPTVILADKASNRIIVTAAAEKLPDIEKLIRTLDTEKPADLAVRVVQIHNVDAKELESELKPMYAQTTGRTGALADVIQISANQRSNSLIVLSSLTNFRSVETLVRSLDTEDAQQKTMRSFRLEHADAEDIAKQLEDLYSGDQRSNRFWWGGREESSRDKLKFVANRRNNEIIAIGPNSGLERVAEMLKVLDAPIGAEELAPRIYPLKYVLADDIKEVLDELFKKKDDNRPYWFYDEMDSGAENRDVGRLYGKVRFASESYSNSIIVTTNSVENFKVVEHILEDLDRRSPDREATMNIALRHAKSVNVANSLNILFAQEGAQRVRAQPAPNQPRQPAQARNDSANVAGFEFNEEAEEESYFPWLGAGQNANQNRGSTQRTSRPVSDLIGKVRIVPDTRTNSLLITTSPHLFPQVEEIVKNLDQARAQVMLEARIIEITRDDRDRIGVRWSPDGSRIFNDDDLDNSISGTGVNEHMETYLGTTLANAMRTGVVSSTVELDLLIQFLRRNSDSRVRAEPRLQIADNERGKLFVGSRVPFISGSLNTAEGGRNDSFEYTNVGVTLEVTPIINSDNDVSLRIKVESSQLRPGETLFGGAIIDTRNYLTEMTVKAGEVLVLGGIIQREETEIIRKIPLLGDIPIIGWYLFSKRDTVKRDVELMVFLKPRVTRSSEEARKLMEDESERTPLIRAWEEELGKERRADEKAKD